MVSVSRETPEQIDQRWHRRRRPTPAQPLLFRCPCDNRSWRRCWDHRSLERGIADITRRHMAVNVRKFLLQAHSLDELVALGTLTA